MVSCEKYEDCFGSTNMSAMNNCLNGRTHGPVHILIGGEWGNPEESFTDTVGKRGSCILSCSATDALYATGVAFS